MAFLGVCGLWYIVSFVVRVMVVVIVILIYTTSFQPLTYTSHYSNSMSNDSEWLFALKMMKAVKIKNRSDLLVANNKLLSLIGE